MDSPSNPTEGDPPGDSALIPPPSMFRLLTARLPGDLRRALPMMLAYEICCRIILTALATPLAAWLLGSLLARSGSSAVSNASIARFLLTPAGLAVGPRAGGRVPGRPAPADCWPDGNCRGGAVGPGAWVWKRRLPCRPAIEPGVAPGRARAHRGHGVAVRAVPRPGRTHVLSSPHAARPELLPLRAASRVPGRRGDRAGARSDRPRQIRRALRPQLARLADPAVRTLAATRCLSREPRAHGGRFLACGELRGRLACGRRPARPTAGARLRRDGVLGPRHRWRAGRSARGDWRGRSLSFTAGFWRSSRLSRSPGPAS